MVESFCNHTRKIIHNEKENSFTVKKIDPSTVAKSNDVFEYIIEPDASSASYPFSLAAATGSTVTLLSSTTIYEATGLNKITTPRNAQMTVNDKRKNTKSMLEIKLCYGV